MPTLLEVQGAVARDLIAGDDGGAEYIVADGIAGAARLNVYRNTLIGGLTTALRLAYPAVFRLVGAPFFESAARIFIAAQPPTSACLDDYHPAFADFLDEFPPAVAIAYLAGVARLDWAANRALHAPDAAALDPVRLGALDPAEQARVRFMPHPSVGLVRAEQPVDAIWRAVLAQDDAAMAAIDLGTGPVHLLVQRRDDGPTVSRLDEGAWRFTALLCAGCSLQDAIDAAGDTDVSALLAIHLTNGVFTDFTIGDAGTDRLETVP